MQHNNMVIVDFHTQNTHTEFINVNIMFCVLLNKNKKEHVRASFIWSIQNDVFKVVLV